MKSTLFFFLTLNFIRVSAHNPIPANAFRPVFDHLREVNAEWAAQEARLTLPALPVHFENDDERIQHHLQLVETTLRAKETAGLTVEQKRNRLRLLDVLRKYWQTGKFPRNTGRLIRRPYFVDKYGTACAVGYLMLQSGEASLVQRISSKSNFAYVMELAVSYPELLDWAKENGFQPDELAWIQPTYPPAEQQVFPVGNGGGADGRVNVMANLSSQNGEWLVMAGDFTKVDGVAANSIIAWDGSQWHTFGEGVLGEIHALHTFYGTVYAAGNFSLPEQSGVPVNFAVWKADAWAPLQTGDMEGSIYSMGFCYGHLFIGGDFKKLNGQNVAYLAAWDISESTWTTNGVVNNEEIPGILSTNGPVHCMSCKTHPYLLLGGDFTTLSVQANHPAVNPLATNHLAYWNADDLVWENTFEDSPLMPVHALAQHDGYLIAASKIVPAYEDVWTLDAGIWQNDYSYFTFGDNLPHGFVEHEGKLMIYGGFVYEQLFGIISFGIIETLHQGSYTTRIGFMLDNTVRAGASYKGNAYFAGDFTMVNGQPFNGMFQSPLSGPSGIEDIENQSFVKIRKVDRQLSVQSGSALADAELRVFDLQGRCLFSHRLTPGLSEYNVPLADFPRGIYTYRLTEKKGIHTGKFTW